MRRNSTAHKTGRLKYKRWVPTLAKDSRIRRAKHPRRTSKRKILNKNLEFNLNLQHLAVQKFIRKNSKIFD
jgi:hypothetical protein